MQLTAKDVVELIPTLPKKHRLVITARLGLDGSRPKTLKEVGQLLGVTRERTRQIETQAIKKLRKRLKDPTYA